MKRLALPGHGLLVKHLCGCVAACLFWASVLGQQSKPAGRASAAESAVSPAGVSAPWLDALQRSADALLWTDQVIRHDWRLQRRPGSDACRILDEADDLVREGTYEECLATLTALAREGRIRHVRGPSVIVLHGLGEGRRSMRPLVEHLRKHLDATVMSFGYASTAAGLDDHGRALAAVVADLPAGEPVSFVGHSLGNLVVRRWMGLAPAEDLARVGRMVMLGPPNQGSQLARTAARFDLLASLASGAARELVLDWDRVSRDLATPPCPFGIVAGGRGDQRGYSSLLTGDDDAVVRVEETTLPGADDFLLVPVHHAAMMRHPDVQRATTTFLATGRFAVRP